MPVTREQVASVADALAKVTEIMVQNGTVVMAAAQESMAGMADLAQALQRKPLIEVSRDEAAEWERAHESLRNMKIWVRMRAEEVQRIQTPPYTMVLVRCEFGDEGEAMTRAGFSKCNVHDTWDAERGGEIAAGRAIKSLARAILNEGLVQEAHQAQALAQRLAEGQEQVTMTRWMQTQEDNANGAAEGE